MRNYFVDAIMEKNIRKDVQLAMRLVYTARQQTGKIGSLLNRAVSNM